MDLFIAEKLQGTVPFEREDDSPESRIAQMFATGIIDEAFLATLAKATAEESSSSQLLDVFKEMRRIYGPETSERLLLERAAKQVETFMRFLLRHAEEDGLPG